MKILVTGASGFIGLKICLQLKKSKHTVYGISRNRCEILARNKVRQLNLDLLSDNLDEITLLGVDAVVHCAATAELNAGKTQHFASFMVLKNLLASLGETSPLFIYLSSIAAVDRASGDNATLPLNEKTDTNPQSHYGEYKLKCEELIKKSAYDFIIIRPSLVVGDGMRMESHFRNFARIGLKGSVISRLPWSGKFSVVHVEDLANAVICVLEKSPVNETYFCAGNTIKISEFFEFCGVKTYRKFAFFNLRLLMTSRFFPYKLKCMMSSSLVADDSKLRSIGWVPSLNINEQLSKIIQEESCELPQNFYKKPSVITGAASGLGLAISKLLISKGSNIIVVDMDKDRLWAEFSSYPNVKIFVCDLANEVELMNLIKLIENDPEIANLFLCAGFGVRGAFAEENIKLQLKLINVMLNSRLQLVHAFKNSRNNNYINRLIMISSSSALQGLPYMSVYSAINSALMNFMNAINYEGSKNEYNLVVCPSGMKTNFQTTAGVKMEDADNLLNPNDVAVDIFKSIYSRKKIIFIGRRTHIMALMSRILPININIKIWGKLMEKLR